MHHIALGAGSLEEFHLEFALAVGAGNFQRRGHGLFVEAHHAHFIDDTFSIITDTGASIMHYFSLSKGKLDRFNLIKIVKCPGIGKGKGGNC